MRSIKKLIILGMLMWMLNCVIVCQLYFIAQCKQFHQGSRAEQNFDFLSHKTFDEELQKKELDTKTQNILMRKNKNNIVELRCAFESTIEKLQKQGLSLDFNKIKSSFMTRLLAAEIDAEEIYLLDEDQKKREAEDLKNLIQKNIRHIQNPQNCSNAKTLTCRVGNVCGYGCQFHHVAYCFMIAYGLQRTLIYEFPSMYDSWETFLLPLSETCIKVSGQKRQWRGKIESESVQHVHFKIFSIMDQKSLPPFRPLGIPKDIGQRLLQLHGNPSVWWVGQFVHYLLRPQPRLKKLIDRTMKKIGQNNTFVGIHVRRTDKIFEANYHDIEEYMKHVTMWYDKLDLKLSKAKSGTKVIRRVFLASDDPSIYSEAKRKYPDYVFYRNEEHSKSAALAGNSKSDLWDFLIDVFMLSKSNFLCCTFSSNVCRLSFELMQHLHSDASDFFYSLDDMYYYVGQINNDHKAVYPHTGDGNEIDLEVGDFVDPVGNHWNGYSKGRNRRTDTVGLYPSYKVEEIFRLVNYPTYEKAIRNSRRSN